MAKKVCPFLPLIVAKAPSKGCSCKVRLNWADVRNALFNFLISPLQRKLATHELLLWRLVDLKQDVGRLVLSRRFWT